ncbi:hypothetical protein N7G274_008548 [Stereocaulon virgatum]|uniref:IMP-specific 5'-nucleotidase 1 n=1 Tax=Stereocaulon virgatum TaxID=373712 RepID=A0ABR4A143_9LECA
MTTRYRVEYALKTHRRDQLIEWIKGLLAVPFVLHSQPTAVYDSKPRNHVLGEMALTAHRRYAEILHDVEELINDHIALQKSGTQERSKLKHLVPSVGLFFTPLLLEKAFEYQDEKRRISSRRFVPPSFNDIRLILNSAQVMSLIQGGPLELVTFDGDVTLYADGQFLTPDNPVIPRIINLLSQGVKVGIVTAAGYTEASNYFDRLYGLLNRVRSDVLEKNLVDPCLIILGGESNYLFKFDVTSEHFLEHVDRQEWMLPEMSLWSEKNIEALLDVAEKALRECILNLGLCAEILRKERAVGIIPIDGAHKLTREQLEETVLVTQQVVEMSPAAKFVPFCAFNGGNDIFVDIGDKGWGVLACQRYLGGIEGGKTLHIGDQFLSAGANDFKARLACTTAWIASPTETVELLDELATHSRLNAT